MPVAALTGGILGSSGMLTGRFAATVRRPPVAGSSSVRCLAATSITTKLPHGVWAMPLGTASPVATCLLDLSVRSTRMTEPAASVT
jgi:hypothetical protein